MGIDKDVIMVDKNERLKDTLLRIFTIKDVVKNPFTGKAIPVVRTEDGRLVYKNSGIALEPLQSDEYGYYYHWEKRFKIYVEELV